MLIKLKTEDLRLGMYVSKLDRPWIGTSFLFQGFIIRSSDELKQLEATCEFVYVDEEKSEEEATIRPVLSSNQPSQKTTVVSTPASDEDIHHDFKEELSVAAGIHSNTKSYITSVLEDSRLGGTIDTGAAKEIVANMADSIVRNPNALVWLTHLKQRDDYTAIHSMNVCIISLAFARSCGYSVEQLNTIGMGALLHDIGKMKVPDEILNKPDKLTEQEFDVMKKHPVYGYELLKNDKYLSAESLDIVLSHHEHTNGSGYPNALKGHEIKPLTRITCIVDVYDAVTSGRVYHDAMTPHDALKNMYNWMPGNFDKDLVEIFIRSLGIYPIGTIVELTTGQTAIVSSINENHRLKPTVMLILDKNKQAYATRSIINLSSEMKSDDAIQPLIKRVLDPDAENINVSAIIHKEALGSTA